MTSVAVHERPPGSGGQTEASSGHQESATAPPIRAVVFFLLAIAGVGVGGYLFGQQQGLLAARATITQQDIQTAVLRRQLAETQTTLAQEHLEGHTRPSIGAETPRNDATPNAGPARPANSDPPQDRRLSLTSGRWVGTWASTPISLVFARSGMVVQSRAQQIWETPGDDADNSWTLEGDKVIFPVFFVQARSDNTLTPIRAVPTRAACVFEATLAGDHLNGISSGCGAGVHLTHE